MFPHIPIKIFLHKLEAQFVCCNISKNEEFLQCSFYEIYMFIHFEYILKTAPKCLLVVIFIFLLNVYVLIVCTSLHKNEISVANGL